MIEGEEMASGSRNGKTTSKSTRSRHIANPILNAGEEHLFTIGTMARDFQVSLRALRFYEDRGLLHPIRRGSTRLYTSEDRQHLEMILRGKRLGFTLAEIHDLIGSRKDKTKLGDLESTLQPEQIIAQIGHLERQRDEIDEAIKALRHAHQMALDKWASMLQKTSSSVPPFEA